MTDVLPRMSVLDPAGRQALEIKWLWDVFYGVSIAVWVTVVAFFVIATVHSRRRAEDAVPERRDRRMLAAVVAAGGATVVTLIALLVTSIASGRYLATLHNDADTVHVRITGRQWWWQIDYEPRDPMRTATTANELHVPVGRTVELELTSGDVIHSFWVPSIHGKRDLIPGRTNRMFIRVDEPGVFRGQCAEFCGLEHAQMILTIVAEPTEQFERWRIQQRAPAGKPTTPLAQQGLAVFLSVHARRVTPSQVRPREVGSVPI